MRHRPSPRSPPESAISIFTFTADDPECAVQAIAKVWGPFGIKKNKTIPGWAVIYFPGPDAATCRAMATKWWDDEVEKERAKVENSAKRVAARKATSVPAVVQTPPDQLGDIL